MLGAEAPPTDVEIKKAAPRGEVDIFAAIKANGALSGIGELSRPRQEAVNLFPRALHEGSKVRPPYTPFLPRKLGGDPRAPHFPERKGAAGAGRARQRRNDVETSFLMSGQLAPSYLRYIVAGEIAGDWEQFGGSRALLTNLAHLLELSVAQDVSPRFEIRARADLGVVTFGPKTRKPPVRRRRACQNRSQPTV